MQKAWGRRHAVTVGTESKNVSHVDIHLLDHIHTHSNLLFSQDVMKGALLSTGVWILTVYPIVQSVVGTFLGLVSWVLSLIHDMLELLVHAFVRLTDTCARRPEVVQNWNFDFYWPYVHAICVSCISYRKLQSLINYRYTYVNMIHSVDSYVNWLDSYSLTYCGLCIHVNLLAQNVYYFYGSCSCLDFWIDHHTCITVSHWALSVRILASVRHCTVTPSVLCVDRTGRYRWSWARERTPTAWATWRQCEGQVNPVLAATTLHNPVIM